MPDYSKIYIFLLSRLQLFLIFNTRFNESHGACPSKHVATNERLPSFFNMRRDMSYFCRIIFAESKFKDLTRVRENFSSSCQMWGTKSTVPVELIGRKDEAEKCNRARSDGISPWKSLWTKFRAEGEGGWGSQVQMERSGLSGGERGQGSDGERVGECEAHIRVHVGVFAIKLTRKQRLCQRHRAPLDRYIFISISRMFLKPL